MMDGVEHPVLFISRVLTPAEVSNRIGRFSCGVESYRIGTLFRWFLVQNRHRLLGPQMDLEYKSTHKLKSLQMELNLKSVKG